MKWRNFLALSQFLEIFHVSRVVFSFNIELNMMSKTKILLISAQKLSQKYSAMCRDCEAMERYNIMAVF